MAYNTMTKLDSYTVGAGGVSSVTFSNISQAYTDLVVKVSARGSTAAISASVLLSVNGLNTGNSYKILYGNSSAGFSFSGTDAFAADIPAASTTTSTFSNNEIYFPNYTSSNYKTYSIDAVIENNSGTANNSYVEMFGELWGTVNPISSLAFTLSAGNFAQYTTFTLYGVYSQTDTPATPTISSASDLGGGTASVAISSPLAVPYEITSSPGSIVATGMSPVSISGLSPQTAYTFTAKAVAPWGKSSASSASSSVSMYNGMTALATTTVGAGGASSIDFTSIDQNYRHLQLRVMSRFAGTGTNGLGTVIRVGNGSVDAGTNYSNHIVYGTGSAASTYSQTSTNTPIVYDSVLGGSTANVYGVAVIDILDYANTNKNKTMRSLYGWDLNGTGTVALASVAWYSTSAINTISILQTSYSFAQYTTITLLGVK